VVEGARVLREGVGRGLFAAEVAHGSWMRGGGVRDAEDLMAIEGAVYMCACVESLRSPSLLNATLIVPLLNVLATESAVAIAIAI
jgi:hypothetical protein